MILHVLDENLTYKGRLESYRSLSWKEQYQGEGGFTLVVDDTDRNAALLQHGFLLYRADRKTAMHVVNVVRSTKQRTITAGGYTELCILERRATKKPYTVSNAEDGIYGVATENLRGLPVEMAENQGFADRWEGVLEEMALSDAVYNVGKYSGLGVKMLVDVNNKKRILTVYRGADKTYSPETGGRVFSHEYGNLRELTVTEDDDLYKNVAIVRGLGQDEKVKEIVIGDVEGLDRREMLVKVPTQSSQQTNAEYQAEMRSAGENALLKQRKVQTFEAEISPKDFGTAYDLGDLVTCNAKRYNLRFDRRITEFTQTVENGVSKIVLTLGEPTISYAESITGKGNTVSGNVVTSTALSAYPVGSVFISSENVDPAETMGGTWELVDKLLKHASYNQNKSVLTATSANATVGTTLVVVDGNTMELYVAVVPKVALGESNVELFTIDLAEIGVKALSEKRITGYADGGNGFVNAMVSASGLVTSTDVVTKTSGGTVSANQTLYFSVVWKIGLGNRMDAFCDRFFWKRTA